MNTVGRASTDVRKRYGTQNTFLKYKYTTSVFAFESELKLLVIVVRNYSNITKSSTKFNYVLSVLRAQRYLTTKRRFLLLIKVIH